MAVNVPQEKQYPGGLERWATLRNIQNELPLDEMTPSERAVAQGIYEVAAELAGLCYILDGIRYATRQGQGR